MTTKRLRVSLVIPVYNEESYLRECLESALSQTVPFYEILVVDNNSTDGTVRLAGLYPGVTILHEARQGVVYARDHGFNAARGDVIARCDGDSILAPDWVATLQTVFAEAGVDAVSGQVTYRDVACARVFDRIDAAIRAYLARHMGVAGELFLYGVNMAVRRSAWHKVRSEVCHARDLHEDLDLAAHLSHLRRDVRFVPELRVSISPRQAAASPREFYRYTWSNTKVYRAHRLRTLRYVRQVALMVSFLYPVIWVLCRGYDPASKRFSLGYVLRNTAPARLSPVSDALPD